MNRAESIDRMMCPLFQAGEGGSIPTSALDLYVVPIGFDVAKTLNRNWHSRLPRYTQAQCRRCYGAEFQGVFYAVAIWARPIARLLPQYEWLELTRMAIAPDAPKNTASRMLSIMARLIKREFPEIVRLVSYQDMEVHAGTIYRAAGWTPTAVAKFTAWDKSRPRRKAQSEAAKQRWEKPLASA